MDAIVFDSPVLQYYASHDGKSEVELAGSVFRSEFYGIALPSGSPLRESLNRLILELKADGTFRALHNKWFEIEGFD